MDRVNEQRVVPPAHAGERLDRSAAALFDFSRAELTRWIVAGELTVDGCVCKPKRKMRGGETLVLRTVLEPRENWRDAQAMMLDVLYEDEHILVLNKPPGLVVHPGAGNAAGTLVNGLIHYRAGQAQLPRAGIVHRLDKDTSGIMIVAGSAEAQRRLTQMIQTRAVQRLYVCVCEGRMVGGADVDQPIGRHPQVRTRQAVRDDGKPARTEFRVRERYRCHTLVDARLHTGRTHQIRVHAQSIGHPLVGDRRYGARGVVPQGAAPELIATLHGFPRQALHAWRLVFDHPVTQAGLDLEAPWPSDFTGLVEALRADAR